MYKISINFLNKNLDLESFEIIKKLELPKKLLYALVNLYNSNPDNSKYIIAVLKEVLTNEQFNTLLKVLQIELLPENEIGQAIKYSSKEPNSWIYDLDDLKELEKQCYAVDVSFYLILSTVVNIYACSYVTWLEKYYPLDSNGENKELQAISEKYGVSGYFDFQSYLEENKGKYQQFGEYVESNIKLLSVLSPKLAENDNIFIIPTF